MKDPDSHPHILSQYVFKSFPADVVVHGIFSRHGGVSPSPYGSLNVGMHVGDKAENVLENRERIKKTLGIRTLASAKQVHGDKIHVAKASGREMEVDGFDAIISNRSGLGLMIQQADCQAVLLFDPKQKAVGNVHVGWRGSVANSIGKTVAAMTKAFGTAPADLLAGISPSLGPCCAEFVNYRSELPSSFLNYQAKPRYFDFWAISRDQLVAAGLAPGNIETATICTSCNHNYFSYRRDKTTGRFASVIGLR